MILVFDRHFQYIQTHGFKKYIARIAEKAVVPIFCEIVFYPVYFMLICLRPFVTVRFSRAPVERIGELGQRLGYYTCEREHGMLPKKSFDIFYYHGGVSNHQLLKMWKRVLRVSYLASFFGRALEKKKYGDQHRFFTYGEDRHGLREKTPPLLAFTHSEIAQAKIEMKSLFPSPSLESAFVCILTRDSAYLRKQFPEMDWAYHDFRNTSISNYVSAADMLASTGKIVLRMGALVEQPLQGSSDRVVDYATSNVRSELLDIYLTAHCDFFITCGSGLDSTAHIFHRPMLYVNYVPYNHFYHFSKCITIPKLLYSERLKRLLTFSEIYHSDIRRYLTSQEYANAGITLIENSADEIKDAADEMMQRLNGTWSGTAEDEILQEKFWKLYPTYEVHGGPVHSKIGAAFLRKYKNLLE